MDVGRRKELLRGALERRRRRVSGAFAEAAGVAVAERVIALPGSDVCERLVLYAAVRGELPVAAIAGWAETRGLPLLWPRVTFDRVEFCVAGRGELSPGAFGVPEPPRRCPAAALGAGDWWLVPGVAFDPAGRRLGRGGGHYDRALAAHDGPLRIGVGYDFQCVDEVPALPHDQAVDWVVTDARSLPSPAAPPEDP